MNGICLQLGRLPISERLPRRKALPTATKYRNRLTPMLPLGERQPTFSFDYLMGEFLFSVGATIRFDGAQDTHQSQPEAQAKGVVLKPLLALRAAVSI